VRCVGFDLVEHYERPSQISTRSFSWSGARGQSKRL
jgi:hypothetical protein